MPHSALLQYFQLYQSKGIAGFFTKDTPISYPHIDAIVATLHAPQPVPDAPLIAINKEIDLCRRCTNISPHKKRIVYGTGRIGDRCFIIGNPPTADESGGRGLPFTGTAFMKTFPNSPGQIPENRFDKMLGFMSLSRENCFITNISKCRPKDNDPTQLHNCLYFLKKQIDTVKPSIILILGFSVANIFFNNLADTINGVPTNQHNIAFYRQKTTLTYQDIPVYVTHNPFEFGKDEHLAKATMDDLNIFKQTFYNLL